MALAEELGLAVWVALGRIIRGWARIEQGAAADGLLELRRGLIAYEATGARLWRAYFLGLQAQALAKTDRVHEGLAALTDARATVESTGEQASAAELYRVHGELLFATAPSDSGAQAGHLLKQALRIARERRSKSWELRVAVSLWGLARGRGERDEARRLVTKTYGWFTEGRDTADLRAARVVLAS